MPAGARYGCWLYAGGIILAALVNPGLTPALFVPYPYPCRRRQSQQRRTSEKGGGKSYAH